MPPKRYGMPRPWLGALTGCLRAAGGDFASESGHGPASLWPVWFFTSRAKLFPARLEALGALSETMPRT